MKECIICQKSKDISEFSKEHIFPDGLLRKIENNHLILYNVCKKCNNDLGLFVDAPVVKYWFISLYQRLYYLKYADLNLPDIIPLIYKGEIEGMLYNDMVCDYWHGPGEDLIFHFHKPFSEIPRSDAIQGIHPISKIRNEDKGIAVMILRSTNPKWYKSILRSFSKGFKRSTKHLISGNRRVKNNYTKIPKELFKLITNQGIIKHTHKVSLGTGERFLAKMALELGSKYLNEAFISSDEANLLRDYLKEPDNKKRQKLKVWSKGLVDVIKYMGPNDKKLSIEGVHTISMFVKQKNLFLYLNFYGCIPCSILISSNEEHWINKFEKGIIIFIAPFLEKIYGPINKCSGCHGSYCVVDEIRNEIINNMGKLKINSPPILK